jgi:hypothetical protein
MNVAFSAAVGGRRGRCGTARNIALYPWFKGLASHADIRRVLVGSVVVGLAMLMTLAIIATRTRIDDRAAGDPIP